MKKGLVILGIAAVAFFVFKKDKAPVTAAQIASAKVGFNLDGSPRQLTDAEATAYIQNNIDLRDLNLSIAAAKEHWFIQGYTENRVIFA